MNLDFANLFAFIFPSAPVREDVLFRVIIIINSDEMPLI